MISEAHTLIRSLLARAIRMTVRNRENGKIYVLIEQAHDSGMSHLDAIRAHFGDHEIYFTSSRITKRGHVQYTYRVAQH